MGNEGDLLGDFVEGFKEENPDVNITVTAIPWASAHDKIQTAIAAGTVPDVIQMGTTWMADFADTFAPVPENFDLSDFSAGPLEAGQVNGEQLGVPWYVDSHVLYYRTDIAEQAGWDHAPETLDELKQMAADVKQVGRRGERHVHLPVRRRLLAGNPVGVLLVRRWASPCGTHGRSAGIRRSS